jgi:hypothetical protein
MDRGDGDGGIAGAAAKREGGEGTVARGGKSRLGGAKLCGGLEPAVPSDCMWPKESAAMLLVQQHGQRGRVARRKCSPAALDGRR